MASRRDVACGVAAPASVTAPAALGDLPLIVVTAEVGGVVDPDYQQDWARLSHNSVHVVAVSAEHGVYPGTPALILEAMRELVTPARTGSPLPACDERLEAFEGRCVGDDERVLP
jgi:hypothetical protein